MAYEYGIGCGSCTRQDEIDHDCLCVDCVKGGYQCLPNNPDGKTTRGTTINQGNTQTLNNLESYRANYSVLGGVVAPKRSAYTIMGMSNPNAQRPTKALDTSLPSLRYNGAVSPFNSFNPYNTQPIRSREVMNNSMDLKRKHSSVIFKTNVNTFQPTGSPVLANSNRYY